MCQTTWGSPAAPESGDQVPPASEVFRGGGGFCGFRGFRALGFRV